MSAELHNDSDLEATPDEVAGDGFPIWASADEILEEDMKTFNEDEVKTLVDAAVAKATAEVQAKLDEIEKERALDEVKGELQTKVDELTASLSDLQAQLDTKVLEAEAAKKDSADILAFLDSVKEEEARLAEVARVRDDRLAKVAEVASFPADYVEANADRWAAMTEDAFTLLVADYATVAKKDSKETEIPTETALVAAKETAKKNSGSVLREVLNFRSDGIDARQVI